MPNFKDITGQRFGRLVAIQPTDRDQHRSIFWICKCDCGTTVNGAELRRGKRRSCGCLVPKPANIKQQRFGQLVAINPTTERDSDGNILWRCECDCGRFKLTTPHDLRRGLVRSCGCKAGGRTHGYARHGKINPTYHTWISMRERCRNPNATKYELYGGRGIKVCERWESFENFLADVGPRPSGRTLDRFPNKDGDYEPSNVRWATILEQRNNQRPPRKRLEQFTTAELEAELRRRKRSRKP